MVKNVMSGLMTVGLLVCGVISDAPVQAWVHPFHVSVAELEWNAQTERLEVSLKLHASDLERALTLRAKRKINLEQDDADGKLCAAYIQEHFFLTELEGVENSRGDLPPGLDERPRSKVNFIGKEFDKSWIVLFFEMERPESEKPLALVNTVLLDLTDGQINTVTVRTGAKKHGSKTNVKTRWVPFEDAWFGR